MFTDIAAEDGFMRMYEFYYDKVYNYIFFRLLNRENTEDLLSEIFLKAFERRASYNAEKAKVSTWLFTIARNTLTDFYRSSGGSTHLEFDENQTPADDFNPEEAYVKASDLGRGMAQCLGKLREADRAILYLKYYMDYDYKEIAVHLGITEKNASVSLTRATKRLKEVYELEEPKWNQEFSEKTR